MKKKKHRTFLKILQILLVLVVGSIYAENLSLDRALFLTLESNPDLKAKELEIQSKQAIVKQVSLLPNPEVEVELQDFGRSEGSLLFSQLVELGGKRARRIGIAKSEKEIAQLQFETHRLEILAETAEKFIQLWEAQENKKYWLESVNIADSVLSIIEHRVSEGASPAVEKIRAEVELANTRIKARNVDKSFTAAKFRLAAMWGEKQPSFDNVESDSLDEIRDLDTSLIFEIMNKSPLMLLQNALIKKQSAELKLAKAEKFTDLEVAAGVKREGETGNNMAVLGLSIGLPLFNRNQGGIQEAKIGHKMSEYDKKNIENSLRAELQELVTAYMIHKNEVETIKDITLPGTEKAFEEVQKLYQHGKTSFLDLLDIQRSLLELKASYVESLTQLKISRIRLEATLGTAFEEIIKGGK